MRIKVGTYCNVCTEEHSNAYQTPDRGPEPEITIPSVRARFSIRDAEFLAKDLLQAVSVAKEHTPIQIGARIYVDVKLGARWIMFSSPTATTERRFGTVTRVMPTVVTVKFDDNPALVSEIAPQYIRTKEAAIRRCQEEIKADIASGRVPATVSRFSELHDHVDANGYGGAFEGMPICADDDSNIAVCHANTDWWNDVHDEVDLWLRREEHRA